MQVCTCCGVACGKCLANEGLLEESTRFRRALERIHRGDQPSHKIAADALTDVPIDLGDGVLLTHEQAASRREADERIGKLARAADRARTRATMRQPHHK